MDAFATRTSLPHLSIADLRGFGDRFGIDYHFPQTSGSAASTPVLHGQVQELRLNSGLHLTHSSVEVLRPYESLSTRSTAFFLLAVLEGAVQLSVAGQSFMVKAGMAMTTQLDASTSALHASHAHKDSLKTLALTLDMGTGADTNPSSWLHESFPKPQRNAAHVWQLPNHLFKALHDWPSQQGLGCLQQRIMQEGLALQLLAHGMDDAPAAKAASLSPGERSRLEKIRLQLEHAPHLDYSLEQLAEQAAMSVSSFRSKFQQAYGVPVFNYVRDRRLVMARQYLLQGYSVQQAAHWCGYRHATNFATAFRKHFGTAPSNVV